MATIEKTTFIELMDAITDYYGKNVWEGIGNTSAFTSAEFAEKITKVPGVTATYLKNGSVAWYEYNGNIAMPGTGITTPIDSNVSQVTTSIAKIPTDTTISQTTGKVVTESGMKAAGTGAKVATTVGKVAVGVGAVASGIQLGAFIDGALYNANPDFWDSIGMSSLNPETWDSICTSEGGKDFFNMVFGINKATGTTQAYMDENALAYVAAYMASQGAFDASGTFPNPNKLPDKSVLQYPNFDYSKYQITYTTNPITYNDGEVTLSNRYPCTCQRNRTNNYDVHAFSGTVQGQYTDRGSTSSFPQNQDWNGLKYYWKRWNSYPLNSSQPNMPIQDIPIIGTLYNGQFQGSCWDMNYLLYHDAVDEYEPVEGISKQEDGTFPTGITAGMSIAEVLALLKNQYPDLFADGIYNDVIQPDGTIKRFNYVPVGIPDGFNFDQTTGQLKPTGGDLTKQGDTTITDDSTDDLLKQLIDLMTNPDPSNPEKKGDNTDYPDTGSGTTPSIVVPVGSASALYSIYNPTQAELNSFGGWLWSSNFVDQLLKLFNDPMQAIIGLHKVFATPEISGTGNIKVGYLDSGVSSKLVGSQYVTVDCGEVSLYEFFGNVFDYAPFTKVYIYLPFIGIQQIDTGEVMRGTLNVVYHVDVLTGACLAEVKVTRDSAGGTLYTYTGNCACQYPISSGSYMGIVASLASVVGGVIGTVASGGALAPVAMGAVSGVLNAHTDVNHSGGFSGNAGAMGIKKPYLIIRRPQTALAENFQHFNGKPSNHYTLLSSCTGYVKCLDCHLEGIPATGEELAELDNLLKSGIII